ILTIANDGGLSGVVINADGTLTIPVNAVGGSYTVTYQMCEVAAPSYCVTSTANVAVLGASTSTSTNAAAELADTGISVNATITIGALLVAAAILTIKRRYIYKYNVKL
ncbi:MAG: LPXTG cell wall anchor domain-containing protein, partial [bacterium]|nr:LPXTG cell wall anchor domain-containing protein [bacterium]